MGFRDFLDTKNREAVKHLKIINKILEKNNMQSESHLDSDEPYVFLKANNRNLSFSGVRIYKIGDTLAFRIQKENKTAPYGAAYPIAVEDMFDQLISEDGVDEQKAGMEVMKAIIDHFNKFFEESSKAEKELRDIEFWDRKEQKELNV